jgi:glycosyltransferase involved in cell wall biosynthesis
MNILQICAYPPEHAGGSERYAYLLSKYLAKRGHQVHLLTTRGKNLPSFLEESDEKCSLIRKFCFGEIFNVNPLAFIMPQLIREIRWADIVHAHGEFFLTTIQAAFVRSIKKYPLIIQIHGSLDYLGKYSILVAIKKNVFDPTMEAWTLKRADAVASISKKNMQLCKILFGLPDEKLFWLPNAVDINAFKPKPAQKPSNFTVAFIGRLVPWKGLEVFIRSAKLVMKKYEDVEFLVVGGGPLLKNHGDSEKSEQIHFVGPQSPGKIPQLLDSINILVLPSYTENVPTVVLEAMAKQIPVIATHVGGIPEVVSHGETGFLFPPGDFRSCANYILHLIENPEEIEMMGKKGRELSENYHNIENVARMAEEFYERLLSDFQTRMRT